MEGDEEVVVLRIEFRVDGGGVGLEDGGWEGGFVFAVGVGEGGVRGDDEEVADLEFGVGEVAGLPDIEAGGVAHPFVVVGSYVADVVELFGRVVLMDVEFGFALGCAGEVVAAVFDAPEPVRILLAVVTVDRS